MQPSSRVDTQANSAPDADPRLQPTAGVDMDRVASVMRTIDDVASARLAPDAAAKAIASISHAAPAPTWLGMDRTH